MIIRQRNINMGSFWQRFPVTFGILLLNFIFYILTVVIGGGNLWNGGNNSSLLYFGAQLGTLVSNGQPYRMVTSMFLHGGMLHILFNSYALYYFGMITETIYSSSKMFFIYMVSGITGNILTQIFYPNVISVGASGAIFGLVGLLFSAGLRKDTPVHLSRVTGTALLPMIAINLFLGFTFPGINNMAHIGGIAAGFLLGFLIPPRPPVMLNAKRIWNAVFLLCIILVVISIVLNFVFFIPPVEKVVDFWNSYVSVLKEFSTTSDLNKSAYLIQLLQPYDSITRELQANAREYVDSGGISPSFQQLVNGFTEWRDGVSERYGLK